MNLFIFNGDRATLKIYGDVKTSLESKDILDAFNGKNNSTLQLTTDVTVDNIKAKKLASHQRGDTPTSTDFRATINAVATSRAVFESAYIKILVNPQKNNLSQIKGEDLKLRIITDDITKKPLSSDILDNFKTKNKLNPDIVWDGDINLEHHEPTEYGYTITFRVVESSKGVTGVADVRIIVTAS